MNEKLSEFEKKIEILEQSINMTDEYARHFMGQTLSQLSIVLAIVAAVLIGALYFMIKVMMNEKIDKEVEKKIVKILSENPPVYYSRGTGIPSDNKILLSTDIEGIKDLAPDTLMILEVKPQNVLIGNLNGGQYLKPKLKINEENIREIEIENYHENNGLITWSLAWIRKKY
ncbi:hypothetical protein [Neobacillus niacini]|uniref:hypothetical protein n=1 Tax=Neobacillus niacini TaxID=86668 RepID=UPI001C8D12B7|nr:hypothetical protein [Neobacillus niacini]MBY0144326.1 hypothetical protein [Neobacillus niacini]